MSLFKRKPKHVHAWGPIASHTTEVFGDSWGRMTKLPTSRYTDLSSVCTTCGAPLKERVSGVWVKPAEPTKPTPTRGIA